MTVQEASITISVDCSVDTFEDILLLIHNLLTGRDKRPRTPGYLYFKTLLACLLVREFMVLNKINDHVFTPLMLANF